MIPPRKSDGTLESFLLRVGAGYCQPPNRDKVPWAINERGSVVHRFIARANVDHCLGVLNSTDLTPKNRETVTKSLIAEEDKLSHDLEHLEFAEGWAARSRDRVNYLRKLRDTFADGSTDRAQAEEVLANFEATHLLTEQFCHRIREKVTSRDTL
jgi:hypothetical protein